jgi:group I intron endonuclease
MKLGDYMDTTKEDKMKIYCAYMHVNKINGKKYVGITCQDVRDRWKNGSGYREGQSVFFNAIQKYGWENFEHVIVKENLSFDEASKLEIDLIALHKTNCCKYKNPEYGYNMTDGGDGHKGWIPTEENRKNMSNSHKGRKLSEEHKLKIGSSVKGRVLSDEHKQKISQSNKNRFFSDETKQKISNAKRGKPSPKKGIPMSSEQKRKLSEIKKKENLSEDTIRKMRESASNKSEETRNKISQSAKERYKDPTHVPFYGKHHTEETKQKLSNARKKPVLCLSIDGNIIYRFDSVAKAAKETDISTGVILDCCKGRRESYKNMIFIYESEYSVNNILDKNFKK